MRRNILTIHRGRSNQQSNTPTGPASEEGVLGGEILKIRAKSTADTVLQRVPWIIRVRLSRGYGQCVLLLLLHGVTVYHNSRVRLLFFERYVRLLTYVIEGYVKKTQGTAHN
jgi:hypothetical protein